MKTPEEIKKGLAMCSKECTKTERTCKKCPYRDWGVGADCIDHLEATALAYIKQLEEMAKPNEQIRWERDIAIGQLKELGVGFGEKVSGQLPKWISVEDRLPEHRVNVLCKYIDECNEDAFTIGWFSTGYHSWMLECSFDESACGRMEVTHWMPLPEAPKEDV